MDIPMLDENEYAIASKLYSEAFKMAGLSIQERFKPMLDYYYSITGFNETEPNAIMHHRIAAFGPLCENCLKPYRTPTATFCAACGNKRENTHNTK